MVEIDDEFMTWMLGKTARCNVLYCAMLHYRMVVRRNIYKEMPFETILL
jgi:hypothetical protein